MGEPTQKLNIWNIILIYWKILHDDVIYLPNNIKHIQTNIFITITILFMNSVLIHGFHGHIFLFDK